jgi:hypothetical protein
MFITIAMSCEVPLNNDFVVAIVVMQAPKVFDHKCIHSSLGYVDPIKYLNP